MSDSKHSQLPNRGWRHDAMTVYIEGPAVGFSGSRGFTDRELVRRVLSRVLAEYPECIIRVGDARSGLDVIVAEETVRLGRVPDVQECYWPPGTSTRQERWEAAHERNSRVVAGVLVLYAFYAPGKKTPGTTDAITQAKAAGTPVHVYKDGQWTTHAAPPRTFPAVFHGAA